MHAPQELEGCLSVSQVERLMTIIDTDHSGTIDFHELAKGLQKIDLRVEVSAPHGYPLGPPPLITSDCPCLPLLAPACPCLPLLAPACPCLPLLAPACPCLPLMAFPLIERRCTSICSW